MEQSQNYARYIAAQDWEKAERALRKAAKAKTATADVFYNLAKVLEAADKPAQMRTWLKRAVAANAGYGMAWFELGRVELRNRNMESALRAFDRALSLDPSDEDARRNAARIALRLGLWDVARDRFGDASDFEARAARYRIDAETGAADETQRDDLLRDLDHRPAALKALTRTARGSLCLSPKDWPAA